MTTSLCDLRRDARYEDLSAEAYSSDNPDTVNFSIAIGDVEEAVELECDWTGKKSIFVYGDDAQPSFVDITGAQFQSWSDDLKRKITELLGELCDWEASMRKPDGPWDIRLLAEPEIADADKEPSS